MEWEQVKEASASFTCIWGEDKDLQWFEQHYHVFNWWYNDDIELEILKVKLCAIANVYGEFCHQAYAIYCPLPDELVEHFQDAGLPFSTFRLGQLVGKDFYLESKSEGEEFEDHQHYLTLKLIGYLAKDMKYKIFTELYTSKGFTPNSLFDSWKLLANSTTNYAGYEYLASWGDTYANYV